MNQFTYKQVFNMCNITLNVRAKQLQGKMCHTSLKLGLQSTVVSSLNKTYGSLSLLLPPCAGPIYRTLVPNLVLLNIKLAEHFGILFLLPPLT